MQIKSNDKHISFCFFGEDGFLDVGYQILSQEKIEELLPYKVKQMGKKEQMIFDISADNIVRLSEILPKMDGDDIVDVVYELFYLIARIEENGFLKRQCIWYKYDNIFYDTKASLLRLAILPVVGNSESSKDWYLDFENVLNSVLSYTSDIKAKKIIDIFNMFMNDTINIGDALSEIDKMGCSVSSVLSENLITQKLSRLTLTYTDKDSKVVLNIDGDEYIIGRDKDVADGVISEDVSIAVSRKHCQITKMNNKFFVQDLDSSNHTLVNGIMIPPYEIMELTDKDILSIADIDFRVKIS